MPWQDGVWQDDAWEDGAWGDAPTAPAVAAPAKSAIEYLLEARDNALRELAAIDATKAGGKPNAAGPHWVDHQGYRRTLIEQVVRLNREIAAVQGPTVGITLGRV